MNSTLRQRYGVNSDRPMIALAPMAGVTDVPFRQLCEQLGADYSVTEMAASAPQLLDSDKNQTRLHFTPQARVKILQIIGNDAAHMADAAKRYADSGADIIDINLGCPAKKVSSKGAGSALLSDLAQVQRILTAITAASPVPVTLKTRLGPDHEHYTLFDIARLASELGIELITVHGRTRACRFNGQAEFTEIARIKQAFPKLAIIANGDIDSPEMANKVLQQTTCDGLMIGRAGVGNPWLFSDIRQRLEPDFIAPSTPRKTVILQHIQQTHDFYGAIKGVRFARKHIQAYFKHLGIATHFPALAKTTDPKQQLQQLDALLDFSPMNQT